ncbi:MAG: EAL domain-containing protein, partial [Kangiellaceae bacterium]|nr:EAL domain-containing protein [Kangiellaceae bacterium]
IGRVFYEFAQSDPLAWAARRGDYDFALLSLANSPDKVHRICVKLVKDLGKSLFSGTQFEKNYVSVGMAVFKSGDDIYSVLASADMALRSAQLEGGNWVHSYSTEQLDRRQIRGGVRWRTFLQGILERRAVTLFFQKQVTSEDMSVTGYEVLSRVADDSGFIEASIFLPMASRFGLSANFDRLVVDSTLKSLKLTNTFDSTELTINLFVESLLDDSFVVWLVQQLSVHKEHNKQIIFEITEGSLSRHFDSLSPVIEQIASLGCSWCVEHVGNPSADLNYLFNLPIKRIKLAKSLVNNIDSKQQKWLFIESLINSCHLAGVDVFGEGVEREQEWRALVDLGIDGGQGFWIEEPLEEVSRLPKQRLQD